MGNFPLRSRLFLQVSGSSPGLRTREKYLFQLRLAIFRSSTRKGPEHTQRQETGTFGLTTKGSESAQPESEIFDQDLCFVTGIVPLTSMLSVDGVVSYASRRYFCRSTVVNKSETAPTGGVTDLRPDPDPRAMQVKTVKARIQGEDRRQRRLRKGRESLQTGSPVVS